MYNKIEIRHSCIIIHDYTPNDDPMLERTFSTYDKVYRKYNPKGRYYDKNTRCLYLPLGMDLYFVVKSFGDNIFRKVHPDDYDMIDTIKLKYPPRDELQKKAIRFCLGEGEYMGNRNSSQIQLNLNTGAGKTYVAITVSAILSVKTMMITSSLDWINQWKERLLEYTNLKEDEIYIIAGSSSIAKLIKFNRHDKIRFYLCSHDTLKSFATKYGWDSIRELFKSLKIGNKIYDEAHLYFDNICMIDFFTDVWKTFYLTATPIRSDNKEDFIYQIAFKNVPKLSLFNEETDPRTEYIAILFNSHPSPIEIQDCQGAYGFNVIKYTQYLITKPNYFKILQLLMQIIQSQTTAEGKVLIYIGTNKAILATYYWLIYYYPQYSIGIFSSLTPKEQKRQQLENKIILTTIHSAGAALDIKGLELTILLNEPFKSQVYARQTLGRTRAQDTKYIEVVDIGFEAIRYYYNSKKKIFKKYAKSMSEIRLSDFELNNRLSEIATEQREALEKQYKNPNLGKIKEVVEVKK